MKCCQLVVSPLYRIAFAMQVLNASESEIEMFMRPYLMLAGNVSTVNYRDA